MSDAVIQSTVTSHPQGDIIHARLHGAKRLNLVDDTILSRGAEEFSALATRSGVRAVFLSGASDQAFVGGANLNVLGALDTTSAEPFIRTVHGFCAALREAPVPVVAVMQGYCLGAGLEIAAACDFRIGDHSVHCGMPEVRVGVPSVVEAALLPGLIGWGKARELMLRGHIIGAEESLAIGLLQHLVPHDELPALIDTISVDFLDNGPRAVADQKALFLRWENELMDDAIESGVHAIAAAYRTDEPARHIAAFFAGRAASGD